MTKSEKLIDLFGEQLKIQERAIGDDRALRRHVASIEDSDREIEYMLGYVWAALKCNYETLRRGREKRRLEQLCSMTSLHTLAYSELTDLFRVVYELEGGDPKDLDKKSNVSIKKNKRRSS